MGPAPIEQRGKLFGRDRELEQVEQELMVRGVLLLYAPSGAGKSSLIQAGLVPQLEGQGFPVLARGRLAASGPEALNLARGSRLDPVKELLTSLGAASSELRERRALREYLHRRVPYAPALLRSPVLVIDQFEELFTFYPSDEARMRFLDELTWALAGGHYRCLLAMRQELLPELLGFRETPAFRRWLLTGAREEQRLERAGWFWEHLGAGYRLGLLRSGPAREAVQKTFALGKVSVDGEPLEMILTQLTEPGGRAGLSQEAAELENTHDSPVEPLHLQLLCHQIYARSGAAARLTRDHIIQGGSLDEALQTFYAGAVKGAARCGPSEHGSAEPDILRRERRLRRWIETRLITPQDRRIRVPPEAASELREARAGLDALERSHVVTRETSPGSGYYELAHDRLIELVRKDNEEWYEANLGPDQVRAQRWQDGDRSVALLLTGAALKRARAASTAGPLLSTQPLDPLIPDAWFLAESEAAAKRRASWRALLVSGPLLLLIAGASIFFGVNMARQKAEEARQKRALRLVSKARMEAPQSPALALIDVANAFEGYRSIETEGALLEVLDAASFVVPTDWPEQPIALALSPSGDLAAFVEPSEEISIRKTTDGSQVLPELEPKPKTGDLGSCELLFTGNRRLLASTGAGIYQIDLGESGARGSLIQGSPEALGSIAASQDGKSVICFSQFDGVQLRDHGGQWRPLPPLPWDAKQVALSPDGRWAACADSTHNVCAIQTTTGASKWLSVPGVSASPVGLRFIGPSRLLIIEPERLLRSTPGADGRSMGRPIVVAEVDEPIVSAASTPGSSSFATMLRSGTVLEWYDDQLRNAAGPTPGRLLFQAPPGAQKLAISGSRAITLTSGGSGAPRLRRPGLAHPLGEVFCGSPAPGRADSASEMAFPALSVPETGSEFAWYDGKDQVYWSAASPAPISLGGRTAKSVAVSPSGKRLAACVLGQPGTEELPALWYWSEPGARPRKVPLADSTDVAFLGEGDVVTGSRGGLVRYRFTSESSHPTPTPLVSVRDVTGFATCPARESAAAITANGDLYLWNGRDRRVLGPTRVPMQAFELALSAGGERLCVVGGSGQAALFDVRDKPQLSEVLPARGLRIDAIAISRDGKRLAAGYQDGSLGLWDLEQHRWLSQPLTAHPRGVTGLGFEPGSGALLSCGRDGTVKRWSMRPEDWRRKALELARILGTPRIPGTP